MIGAFQDAVGFFYVWVFGEFFCRTVWDFYSGRVIIIFPSQKIIGRGLYARFKQSISRLVINRFQFGPYYDFGLGIIGTNYCFF